METSPEEKFRELLEEFDVAMFVTVTDDGDLRSRPMAIADVDNGGTVWFLTQRDAEKVHELRQHCRANVAMQSAWKFISISGIASVVDDRQKVAELWKESWKVWFPGGKDDPDLVLLQFDGEKGEYWDNSGTSGIKYLIEAGRAYLTGTHPQVDDDPKIHAKVVL